MIGTRTLRLALAWCSLAACLAATGPARALRTEPLHTDVALGEGLFGPLRAIGRLEVRKPFQGHLLQASGTAFFVAPCHIVTAAHLLFSKEEESRLFETDAERGRVPLPRGELLAFVKELQREIDARSPRGEMRFHVVRDAAGDFDPARALHVEHIVGVSFPADIGVLRVDRCLGVPERQGRIPLPEADRERADRTLAELHRHGVPMITAGFPGDQPGDALRVNSSAHWTVAGRHVAHAASTERGASGGPVFALVRRIADGRFEGADRAMFDSAAGRLRLARDFRLVLAGINVSHNADTSPGNFARRLPVGPIEKAIREDHEKHRARLDARIARERQGPVAARP